MSERERTLKLRSVFVVNFILTLGIAATSYIDSSFVETFTDRVYVGMLFTTASLLSLIYLAYAPDILEKFGARRTFKTACVAYIVAILLFLTVYNDFLLQLAFLLYWISGTVLYMTVDVILQHYSDTRHTGSTRGFYLTFYNLAFMIGPFLAGVLAEMAGIKGIYAVSGFFVAMMASFFLREFRSLSLFPKKHSTHFTESFIKLFRRKDLRNVFLVAFTLNFFFAWMSIYMPIYLRETMGFSWGHIGAMFALMHIPYVMFEIPWGMIADRYIGEKELMHSGIIIVGFSSIVLSFITSQSFWVWAAALFITRLGASMLQVTIESYFFKKIKKEDTNMVSVFRNAGPIALLIAPVVATFFLTLTSYKFLFLILGILVFIALIPIHKIHDTK